MLISREHGFFARMWMHLGTALFLLLMILTAVFYVARQISLPLRRLSGVVDTVRRTGDHSLRAHWDSGDEIGRAGARLQRHARAARPRAQAQQELAASARAAEAQRDLVAAIPIPLMVTAIPDHEVLNANPSAQAWLGGGTRDPWALGVAPGVRSRFFQQLADRGAVDEFEVRWLGGTEPSWAVLSARRLVYQGQDALLTAFTPINHLKLMEQRLMLWAKVFEASSEGILIIDGQHRILT
jgi:PAS domain-containing protein